jgi:hypothetical protein
MDDVEDPNYEEDWLIKKDQNNKGGRTSKAINAE